MKNLVLLLIVIQLILYYTKGCFPLIDSAIIRDLLQKK